MNGDHYAGRVRWSGEDEAYVATVAEMPSLAGLPTVRWKHFYQNPGCWGSLRMRRERRTPPVPLADLCSPWVSLR